MSRMMVPFGFSTPRLFDSLRKEMDDVMTRFFGPEDGGELTPWFVPRTNLAETDAQFEVSLDLPGMKPEDFSVELKEGHLWVTGERIQEREEKGKTYHRVERQYGRFQRAIPIPANVQADKVEAQYKDGVLRITVPKDEAAQPKRIAVKA